MIPKSLTEDEGVVQEGLSNIPGEASQHEVHGLGESSRGVAQSEPHLSKFVQAVPGDGGCFPLVLWANLNLMKGRVSVQLGEPHVHTKVSRHYEGQRSTSFLVTLFKRR